jgi:hypothetical protein
MARYVNLLDTAFQNFSTEPGQFHTDEDPIRNAKRSLRGQMADDIQRIMRDINYDVMPNLPLPSRLIEQDKRTDGGRRKVKEKEKDAEIDVDKSESPPWWKTNPAVEPAWGLPVGSKFKDCFDPGSPKGRVNLARLPRLKHHNSVKIKLKRNLCVQYQSEGECEPGCNVAQCKPGCNVAHVPPSKMAIDVRAETDKALKEAYAS